jgi:glycerol-3-phosphate acyltransferase PlsY
MLEYTVFLAAYLLGSIPFALYRLLGKKWGIGVLIADAIKGGLAAFICLYFFGPWGGVAGGLLSMIGHSWNPYFGFKPSGKGVASGFGIITVLMPDVMLISVTVFIIIVAVSRYVSLGSVMGALTVLVMVFAFPQPNAYRLFAFIAVSMVVFRHVGNMKRIVNGTEAKFGRKNDGE